MEKDFKQKQTDSSLYKIEKVQNQLKMQWNYKGNCMHNSWDSLALSVRLSTTDIPMLKEWVSKNNLNPPIRKNIT